MEIKITTENGKVPVTIMHVDGNIDSLTAGMFLAKAEELIVGGARYILVDLSHVPFISSAGLRSLNDIFNHLRSLHTDVNLSDDAVKEGIVAGTYKSPHLKLLNLSKDVKHSFELSGFDLFIETYTDQKAAVASF